MAGADKRWAVRLERQLGAASAEPRMPQISGRAFGLSLVVSGTTEDI